MDNLIKLRLVKLRVEESKSYGAIAEELGLSVNTEKSFCYRNNLGDEKIQKPKPSRNELIKQRPPKEPRPVIGYCKECGGAFIQPPMGHLKMYCIPLCQHRHYMNNPATYIPRFCEVCGKLIKERDHRKPRKYCSLECYRTARYYFDGSARKHVSYCTRCGKEIELTGHKKRKYCSPECYYLTLRGV